MLDINDRPGTIEQYESATDTSNMAMVPHRRGAADVIAAAGLADEYGGTLLIRLRREWDRAQPKRFTEEMVAQHAATLPLRKGKPDLKRARTDYLFAYRTAVREAAEAMAGREQAVAHLTAWAMARGIDPETVGPTLTWWLHPTCIACGGHGRRRLPDAPVLGLQCFACYGSGQTARPLGSAALLDHINNLLAKVSRGVGKRLR